MLIETRGKALVLRGNTRPLEIAGGDGVFLESGGSARHNPELSCGSACSWIQGKIGDRGIERG